MTAEPGTERLVSQTPESMCYSISEYVKTKQDPDGIGVWTEYQIEDGATVIATGITDRDIAEDIANLPILRQMVRNGLTGSLVPRLVPVQRYDQRPDHAVLVSIAQLQEETLAELRHIRAALTADDRKDSFSFDNNASAGKVKVSGKRYAATIEEARADAELEFARGMAFVEEAAADGWRATVEKLEAAQNASTAALTAAAMANTCLCEHAIQQEPGEPIRHDRRCQFFGGRES